MYIWFDIGGSSWGCKRKDGTKLLFIMRYKGWLPAWKMLERAPKFFIAHNKDGSFEVCRYN